MELRTQFVGKSSSFQRRQNSHFRKELLVVREQRFTDMKAGKVLLFQNQNAFPGAPNESGGCAASRPAANNNDIVISVRHKELVTGGVALLYVANSSN